MNMHVAIPCFLAVATIGAQPVSLEEASRFMAQASLGANMESLEHVANLGFSEWIHSQQRIAHIPIRPIAEQFIADHQHINDIETRAQVFRFALWNHFLRDDSHLRQRVALALSEIFVISDQVAVLRRQPVGMADYYDMLASHAFGNFRDLLEAVTLHPCMGHYLSHAGNQKENPDKDTFPDENYAREVMQLFTIGLYELHPDGSLKRDARGDPIPTYSNAEITAFARIFTGITYDFSKVFAERPRASIETAWELVQRGRFINFEKPMTFVEAYHDKGQKILLNGTTVAPGQSIRQDLSVALDNLFHHSNTPPFFSRLLIQRLVTSNPSPAYLSRVATVFANNGNGIRGDLGAVVRAILLDPEARNTRLSSSLRGKMREPYFTMMRLVKGFDGRTPLGDPYYYSNDDAELLAQRPFSSPSVFNFYLPDYMPKGVMNDNGLVGPEFQIANTQTIPGMINLIENMLNYQSRAESLRARKASLGGELFEPPYLKPWVFDFQDELAIAADPDALIRRLSLILTAGELPKPTWVILSNAISPIRNNPELRVRTAIYLLLLSPSYVIQP